MIILITVHLTTIFRLCHRRGLVMSSCQFNVSNDEKNLIDARCVTLVDIQPLN